MCQLTNVLLFTELLPKKICKIWTKKINQRQNTVCLEQQIHASPENFTPMLLVMLENNKFTPVQRILHQCCWWCLATFGLFWLLLEPPAQFLLDCPQVPTKYISKPNRPTDRLTDWLTDWLVYFHLHSKKCLPIVLDKMFLFKMRFSKRALWIRAFCQVV